MREPEPARDARGRARWPPYCGPAEQKPLTSTARPGDVKPIATFQAEQLAAISQAVGGNTAPGQNGSLAIPNGRTAVVFMYIPFDRGSHTPDRLVHRVKSEHSSLGPPAEVTMTVDTRFAQTWFVINFWLSS